MVRRLCLPGKTHVITSKTPDYVTLDQSILAWTPCTSGSPIKNGHTEVLDDLQFCEVNNIWPQQEASHRSKSSCLYTYNYVQVRRPITKHLSPSYRKSINFCCKSIITRIKVTEDPTCTTLKPYINSICLA